ncbi:CotO family spore coat protein [Jeotgalibacillus sp. ET6]|uniref:CotO family spore coat protein n=1 Tax=Jeotgalibacillus sp. ET6 TaxID=3037260 RepID=UPI0024186393|nr:CotO family spore coat protein [Jeotgalibacillus sp. ET6]MDG5473010.1 CotO family spore coat protein [Jeotgalibacillus sp. ET6]
MSNKEEKKAHNPLLYIDQPSFECSKPVMQQVYQTSRTKEKDDKKALGQESTPKKKVKAKPLGYVYEDEKSEKLSLKNQIEIEEEQEKEAPARHSVIERFKPLKPFKEMDVSERLDYLKPFIGKRAPFICLFEFEDKTRVKGVLNECGEEEVTIAAKDGELVKRKKEELKNIYIN